MDELDLWRKLVEQRADLIEAASQVDPGNVAAVARLRTLADADVVHAALDLADARRRAALKFPDRAATLIADREGVEQASSQCVADYKAERLSAACGAGSRLFDLCCGIGGDTMSMTRLRPGDVTAVDRDPLRAWMVERNSGAKAIVADVQAVDVSDAVVHLDPARRDAQGRRHRLADYQPPPSVVVDIMRRAAGGAIKLGPGVDIEAVEGELIEPVGCDAQLEFISERGKLVQAVLWWGGAATGDQPRRATALACDTGQMQTLAGDPAATGWAGDCDIERYLYSVDPAVERADLLPALADQLGAGVPHADLGLLTSDAILTNPFIDGFECLADLPWRQRKVSQWLSAHDGGIVEVKTRGGMVDADQTARSLRGKGGTTFTVFVLRFTRQVRALIARRLAAAPNG